MAGRLRTDAARLRDRERNRKRRKEALLGHTVPGVDVRLRVPEVTKVQRRCSWCTQLFAATVGTSTCPYCHELD